MKAQCIFLCLFATSTVFATPAKHLITAETLPLFQRYLATCHMQNKESQPVYLRNTSREKEPSFSDMTILDLDLPLTMQVNDIAERVLYGDADVVHLTNTSVQKASHLHEILQRTYAHVIHVPRGERGLFIASKYPLSQAIVTSTERENVSCNEALEFMIHGANTCYARVFSNDLSTQVINSSSTDDSKSTPILLVDIPGTLTVVKQQFSPFRLARSEDLLAPETFQILPIRRGGGNDDRGGPYGEVDIGISIGPNGVEGWNASARGGYEDGRGNYAEAEVKTNDQGETDVNVRGGHDNDK